MQATLYSSTADNRVVDKSAYLSVVGTYTVLAPTDITSILTPTIILAYNTTLTRANYCYIPDYGRYYMVTGIDLIPGGRIAIRCNVDVLHTYRTYIRNCRATVIRSASTGTTNIPDATLPIDPAKVWFDGILFPAQPLAAPVGTNQYIIGVVAGTNRTGGGDN